MARRSNPQYLGSRRDRRVRQRRARYWTAVERDDKRYRTVTANIRRAAVARVVPSPVSRVYRVHKQYVRQQIGKRPVPQRIGSVLRLVVHPSDCTRRKNFKKTMMRKLAAQAMRTAGLGGVNRWRRRLKRGEASKNPNPC